MLAFARDVFFWNKCFFLYERVFTGKSPMSDNAALQPLPGPFHLKIIHSNREADQLETDDFRSRAGVTNAWRSLDAGAIAFCIFHGRECANVGWVALNDSALQSLPEPHVKVNFSENESFTGGTLTNPKFRKMGLMTHNLLERCMFLEKRGIVKDKATALKWNAASRRAAAKAGYRIRGTVGFKNRIGRRIWKEWPMP